MNAASFFTRANSRCQQIHFTLQNKRTHAQIKGKKAKHNFMLFLQIHARLKKKQEQNLLACTQLVGWPKETEKGRVSQVLTSNADLFFYPQSFFLLSVVRRLFFS